MRKWFLGLLLLNVIVFAGFYLRSAGQPEPAAAAASAQPGVKKLVLLREAEQSTAVQPAVKVCYTVGPFPAADQREIAGERFKQAGVETRPRESNEQQIVGYRVFLSSFATREAARRKLKEMQRKGVVDASVVEMENGDKGYAILFGVFSDRTAAEERHRAITALGYDPKMEERYQTVNTFWLDFADGKEAPVSDPVFQEITKLMPQIRREETACP
jgi:hypothetical protein